MIKKLAILVIEKAGSIETLAGEKGEIYAAARELIRETNDSGNPDKICRITAIGQDGILKKKTWKDAIPPDPVTEDAPVEVDSEDEEEGSAPEDEAKTLRSKLRTAGVTYSPRSGVEVLRKLVADAGI